MSTKETVMVNSMSFERKQGEVDLGICREDSETHNRSNGSEQMNTESSLSIKFWVSTEPKLEASDHTFDENSDSISSIGRNREIVQINKPTRQVSELDAAASKIQKVYRSYRTKRSDAAATKIQKVYRSYSTRRSDSAATKIQKVYKSYRTRRNLADCAFVAEELWWKASDSGAPKQSSDSLNIEQQETAGAGSQWARARTRAKAAQVGVDLSKDKLAIEHWLENIDPRHRYGHNLEFYYDVWCESKSTKPFFYWLDIGEGKSINLSKCPRTDLQRQCIRYRRPAISAEWTFLLSGLCLEILSIAFDQASSPSKPKYGLFGMILAIAAVLICIWELIYKGKKERVELRRWGMLWWYYHPHSTQLFGTLPDFYGLIGSVSQCICSTVQYVCFTRHANNPIKVSLWPAIFLICLGAKRLAENRNETHGHRD